MAAFLSLSHVYRRPGYSVTSLSGAGYISLMDFPSQTIDSSPITTALNKAILIRITMSSRSSNNTSPVIYVDAMEHQEVNEVPESRKSSV